MKRQVMLTKSLQVGLSMRPYKQRVRKGQRPTGTYPGQSKEQTGVW